MTPLDRALERLTEAAVDALAHGADALDLLTAVTRAVPRQEAHNPCAEIEPLPILPRIKPGLDVTPEGAYNVGE